MNQQPSEQEKHFKAANEKMEREKKGHESAGKLLFCALPLFVVGGTLGLWLLISLFGK